MSARRLFLDAAPGETRGVVVLDGQPERLLIDRGDTAAVQAQGAVVAARVRRIERGIGSAFLDLGEGPDAVMALTGEAAGLSEGKAVEIEIAAPGRRGKGPQARLIGPAEGGPPGLVRPAPDLAARLRAFAPAAKIETGPIARAAADLAEEAALAVEHPLGGGASLAIEPTRALIAIDVDVGAAPGRDRRRRQAEVNRRAVETGARLLRLKGLGGLVVFDLAGRGEDGEGVLSVAKTAFAPDQPGAALGPVTRFGTWQLVLPWRTTPVAEHLLDLGGQLSAATVARRLARLIEAEAARCVRLVALCAPEVAEAMHVIRPHLVERLGPRFDIRAEFERPRDSMEVRTDG